MRFLHDIGTSNIRVEAMIKQEPMIQESQWKEHSIS